jgi:hypothetical protein
LGLFKEGFGGDCEEFVRVYVHGNENVHECVNISLIVNKLDMFTRSAMFTEA